MIIAVPQGGAQDPALEQAETKSGIETRFHAVCIVLVCKKSVVVSSMHTCCDAVGEQQCVQRCKATCHIIINHKLIRHNVHHSNTIPHRSSIESGYGMPCISAHSTCQNIRSLTTAVGHRSPRHLRPTSG